MSCINSCSLAFSFPSNVSNIRSSVGIILIISAIALIILANVSIRRVSEALSARAIYTYVCVTMALLVGLSCLFIHRKNLVNGSTLARGASQASSMNSASQSAAASAITGASLASSSTPIASASQSAAASLSIGPPFALSSTPIASASQSTLTGGRAAASTSMAAEAAATGGTTQSIAVSARGDTRHEESELLASDAINFRLFCKLFHTDDLITGASGSPQTPRERCLARHIEYFRQHYPLLRRCMCPDVDYRTRMDLERAIMTKLVEEFPNRNEKIVIGTIGPGGFFQELSLLIKMAEQQYLDIELIAFEKGVVELIESYLGERGITKTVKANLSDITAQFIRFFSDHFPQVKISMTTPKIDNHVDLGKKLAIFKEKPPHIILLIDLDDMSLRYEENDDEIGRASHNLLDFSKAKIQPYLQPKTVVGLTTRSSYRKHQIWDHSGQL